jgi:ferredoxin
MTAPDLFDQEEDGRVVALVEELDDDLLAAQVRDVVGLCPSRAIRLAE